jgi:hypothetical protein
MRDKVTEGSGPKRAWKSLLGDGEPSGMCVENVRESKEQQAEESNQEAGLEAGDVARLLQGDSRANEMVKQH